MILLECLTCIVVSLSDVESVLFLLPLDAFLSQALCFLLEGFGVLVSFLGTSPTLRFSVLPGVSNFVP